MSLIPCVARVVLLATSIQQGGSPRSVSWTLSSPSGAREPASAERRLQAEEAFAEGEAAYAEGDYRRAAARFGEAQRLVPHPFTLYNLGLAQARAEDPAGAWRSFDRLAHEAETAAERREAQIERDRLRPRVAIVRGTSSVDVCVGDVRAEPRRGRVEVAAPPGAHVVRASQWSTSVRAEAGEAIALDLDASARAHRLAASERVSIPLFITSSGAAAVAIGLGIGAAVSERHDTRTGLAVGASVAAGLGLATGIAGLVLYLKARRAPLPETPACPAPRR